MQLAKPDLSAMSLRRLVLPVALIAIFPTTAAAVPILVHVGVHVAVEAITQASSVAATFAVAHTIVGTGIPTAGGCLDVDIAFLGSSSAICNNKDNFGPHATPIGNDNADANASASSSLLGGGATNTSPTVISKGDFAAAGAYARSGHKVDINAGVPAGAPAATVTITLPGGTKFTASKDPETSFYGFMVTDLANTVLNSDLLTKPVGGLSFEKYLPSSASLGSPTNIYWALFAQLDGGTGNFSVMNFGSLVTTPLTAADFLDISTPNTSIFQLVGDRAITLDILTQGTATQTIALDAAEVHVGAAPEPSTLLLFGTCFVGLLMQRQRLRGAPKEEKVRPAAFT